MNARQYVYAARDRTYSFTVSTVDARLTCQNAATNNRFLKALEYIFDFISRGAVFGSQCFNTGCLNFINTRITLRFFRDTVSRTQIHRYLRRDSLKQSFVHGGRFPIPLGLTRFRHQFVDRSDYCLHLLMSKKYCAKHLIFAQFFRLRFNHKTASAVPATTMSSSLPLSAL